MNHGTVVLIFDVFRISELWFNEAIMRPLCLLSKMIINSWSMCHIKSLGQDRCK